MDKKTNFWKSMWDYSKGFHSRLIVAAVFSGINGIAIACQPLVLKYVFDNGIGNEALSDLEKIHTVIFWSVIYIILSGSRIGSWAVAYSNMLKSVEGFLFNIRSKFFHHIQSLCMRFYDKTSSGEMFNYLMGTPMTNLKNFLLQFALNIPHQVVSLAIAVAAMVSYDWLLTLIMLVGVVVCVLINRQSKKKLSVISKELLKSESEASKYIDNMIHGSRAIKMYAIENDISMNFKRYIHSLREKGVRLSFSQWLGAAKGEMAQYICNAVIYVVGAYSCMYRGLTMGELVAFINCMGLIMSALNSIFNINLLRASAETSLDRIVNVLHTKTTTPEHLEHLRSVEVEMASAKKNEKPCIEFEDVSFGYENTMIFDKFNCSIKYNESIALVGTSGSGKSTVTKLIMRLYETNGGVVRMHGHDIRDFSLHDLRKSIGIVPQDPFIFQGTILENIRMAYPDAPMQEVIEAMEIARVHEFVNDLPKGWNTVVGDDGFGLSGGQRQRIAIARAILGNPEVLIFDEATSALDNISEHKVQMAMEELMEKHTILIVAHRLSTIKNVDRILVFDKGEIVQEGRFEELSKKEGLFKDMLEAAEQE